MKKSILFLTIMFLFTCTAAVSQVQRMDRAKVGGSTPINASAALEVESTTQGFLTPRMTSAQRDLIDTPANALLIFNTSNNTFEVYKGTCSCWVTVYDNGNTAAQSLVNTAPTASSLNYTGAFRDGGTATIVYTYADAQNDEQGATTLQWEIANDNSGASLTNLSTGASATFGPTHVGRYVRIKITPRAATGILNGIAYYGGWNLISSSTQPYGSALSVTGTVAQGSLITGEYTFNGGSGVENTLGSTYNWQSAINNVGLGIQNIALPVNATAHTKTIIPLSTEISRYIRFGVQAKDNASLSATDFVYSNWVGPVTLAAEAAPTVNNLTFSPASPGTNVVLTASYQYIDANDDPEGSSLFQWYTADNATGTNQTAIAGATAATFTVTNVQAAKFIGVGVTPKALTGITTGTQVVYYDPSASLPSATFSFVSTSQTSNTFYSNRVMDASNTITVNINVTVAGSISFSTTTVNGYSFSNSGTYDIGSHNVVLRATGTQTAFNAGGDAFTITGVGTTTQTTTFTVVNVKLGGDFTTHFNGITSEVTASNLLDKYTAGETFNNNGPCNSKPISASGCVGSTFTVGSNTYPIQNINGQCWMTQNLKELPNGVAINVTQWLNTTNSDLGYYGYYNTATTNGSAGWATTEPVVGEGLLYQWSAVMAGSTTERAKGICPTGWHVPSDCEWMYLEHGLGMSLSKQIEYGTRSSLVNEGTPGNKLRSAGAGQTNNSGFSGLLNGARLNSGVYNFRANLGFSWTSSQSDTNNANYRVLSSGGGGVERSNLNKALAFSVRCLKD